MVGSYELARPAPWPTLAAYLADLAAALQRTHRYLRHPSDQSVHGGSQTNHLLTGSPDSALQAFFTAIEEPLREHMTGLGHGDDPLRRRNTGEYRIHGAWSAAASITATISILTAGCPRHFTSRPLTLRYTGTPTKDGSGSASRRSRRSRR